MSNFKECKWICIYLGSRSLVLLMSSFLLAGCTLSVDISSQGIPIEINAPGLVNQETEKSYPLNGQCGKNTQSFEITYPPPAQTVVCTNGEWSAVVDLSQIADGKILVETSLKDPVSGGNVQIEVTKDTSRPSIVLSSAESITTNNTAIAVDVLTSEALKNFSSEDFDVTNAVIGQVKKTDTGYSFILTPNLEGPVSISLPEKIVQDLAGNGNSASNILSFVYDSSKPEVVLSTSSPTYTNIDAINLTGEFDEPISGLTASSFTIVNATIYDFSVSGTSFSLTATAAGQGLVTISLPEAAANDVAGNTSQGSNIISVVYDSLPPLAAFSAPNSGSIFESGELISLNWSALDPNGLDNVSLAYSLDNGLSWSSISDTPNSGVYGWTAPFANSSQVLVRVIAADKAGNLSQAFAGPFFIDSDLALPTVTIVPDSAYANAVLQSGESVSFNYTSAGDFLVAQSAQIELTLDGGVTWQLFASNQNLNGSVNYLVPSGIDASAVFFRVKIENQRGEIGLALSDSFTIDNSPPQLTGMVLNGGDAYAITPFLSIKLEVLDSSDVFIHAQEITASGSCADFENGSGQPLAPVWRAWDSSSAQMSLSFQVSPGDGVKTICSWAKDSLNRMASSALSRTIVLETVNIPVLSTFNVYQGSLGNTSALVGQPVTIDWSASDFEGLHNKSISFAYTLNGSTWLDVYTNLDTSDPSNITWQGSNSVEAPSLSGTYSFPSPTSEFFRIRGRVRDRAGNISISALSETFNTQNWQIYMGSRDRGDGGVGKAAALDAGWNTSMFSIHPLTGDFYFIESEYGIRKLDIRTGLMSTVLKLYDPSITPSLAEEAVFLGTDELPFDQALNHFTSLGVFDMAFDSKGYLYISYDIPLGNMYDGIVYRLDLEQKKIKRYIGGGTDLSSTDPLVKTAVSGTIVFDQEDNLYYWDTCVLPIQTKQSPKKLMKAPRLSNGQAGPSTLVFGGACSYSNPTIGAAAATNNGGTPIYPMMTSVVPIPGKNTIYITGYGFLPIKIINGIVYSTNLASMNGGLQRLVYNSFNEKLYGTSGSEGIFEITPNYASNGNEVLSTYLTHTYVDGCKNDGVLGANACVRVSQALRIDGEGTLFFADGPGINKGNSTRVRYVNRLGAVQTIAGNLPLFGEGFNKSLVRGDIKSIYYKKSDLNLTHFPKGLYFMEPKGMVMGHVNPTTGVMNAIWGNQSAQTITVSTVGVTTTSISPSISMGSPYNNYNGNFLTFDENGLPWLRTMYNLTTVTAGGKIEYLQKSGTITYFNMRADSATPTEINMMVDAGKTNLVVFNRKALFFGGYWESDINSPNYNTFNEMILLDFGSNLITSIMGRLSGVLIKDKAEPAPPGIAASTAHFWYRCASTSTDCFMSFKKGATSDQDRVYFSEKNKLRYIHNPFNTSMSVLNDLYEFPDSEKNINNFIFKEDGSQVFYLVQGELYCHDISSGKSWCNDSSVYPFKQSMGRINSCGNQLTWMDENTLLISTCLGEVLKYTLPD